MVCQECQELPEVLLELEVLEVPEVQEQLGLEEQLVLNSNRIHSV